MYQEQMHYAAEIVELTELFFKEDVDYDGEAKEVIASEHVPAVMNAFATQIESLDVFEADAIKKNRLKPFKRKQATKASNCLCQSVSLLVVKHMDQNCQKQLN